MSGLCNKEHECQMGWSLLGGCVGLVSVHKPTHNRQPAPPSPHQSLSPPYPLLAPHHHLTSFYDLLYSFLPLSSPSHSSSAISATTILLSPHKSITSICVVPQSFLRSPTSHQLLNTPILPPVFLYKSSTPLQQLLSFPFHPTYST